MLGVDLSEQLTRQDARMLRAWGAGWVGRYSHTLTQAEVRRIAEAGLDLLTIFEQRPTQISYFTADQGRLDGQIARLDAQGFGQPAGTVIHATVDMAVTGKELSALDAYISAFADAVAPYKAGIYGSAAVIAHVTGPRVVSRWQTLAWSGGEILTDADIVQLADGVSVSGVPVDVDWARTTVGLWKPPGIVTPPAPVA